MPMQFLILLKKKIEKNMKDKEPLKGDSSSMSPLDSRRRRKSREKIKNLKSKQTIH